MWGGNKMELPSIQQLENFLIYARVRNFTLAAQEANITQSAFSFQMKKLEELVGVQLITRSNRGSELTKAGEKFQHDVQKIIDGLTNCMHETQALAGKSEPLGVGTLMSLGDVLMNRHLAYFQQHNLDLTINVYNLEAREMLRHLRENRLDIISTFLLPQLDIEDFERVYFCNEKMVYFAPNIGKKGDSLTAAEIASLPFAQYSPYYYMNSVIDRYFQDKSLYPAVEAWLSTPYAMMNYCQQNRAGAVLSERFLEAMNVSSGYYDMNPPFNLKCYLVYKKSNPKYEQMKIFINYICSLYKK